MKTKKLLAIIAPAMLLASCTGGNKTTTTISKIDLANSKTLIMGKLTKSTSNDDEEDLISVDEDGNATETEVEVTTGDKTTKTADIKISRLVKLNKEYAVVSCTYNDVTYDLIVNLKDGTCVKFPDSSLLPNSKEKLGGHRAYRKYHKSYGYLNSTVVQPNEDVKLFYYVNHYQCDATDESVYARRLVVLDLTGETPSAKAIVTPSDKHSVQTFAVDNSGNVIYISSTNVKITGEDPESQFDSARLHYDDNKEDVEVSFDTEKYEYIAPTLITGSDGLIYCYLKVKSNSASNFVMASININLEGETPVAEAIPVEESSSQTLETYPEKIFTIKGTDKEEKESVNTVSVTKTNKINQLFSFTKNKKDNINGYSNNFENGKPKPTPSPWKKKDNDKPETKEISSETTEEALSTIEDGFSGNTYSYLFGQNNKKTRRYLKKIKYENGDYKYVDSILEEYFNNLTTDVAEVETDESTDDVTVVVDNGNDTETVVVVDESTDKETEIAVKDVSDVVDVNN